jgi:hypothetical protein
MVHKLINYGQQINLPHIQRLNCVSASHTSGLLPLDLPFAYHALAPAGAAFKTMEIDLGII